jgi:hypothetical protein
MDSGSRPASARDPVLGLREWADAHPLVRHLRGALPVLPDGPGAAVGIYRESAPAPWITIGGETRFSVLRVVSVAPDGTRRLVGQLHATETPLGIYRMRHYVNRPEMFHTSEADDEDSWWIEILEEHYSRGAPPLDTGGVPA